MRLRQVEFCVARFADALRDGVVEIASREKVPWNTVRSAVVAKDPAAVPAVVPAAPHAEGLFTVVAVRKVLVIHPVSLAVHAESAVHSIQCDVPFANLVQSTHFLEFIMTKSLF